MADSQEKSDAMKQRIITHLNSDHQDSLVRYLEHFSHLSSFSARNARLEDITLGSLTIRSSNGSAHIVPIDPPMKSFSEARPRVVAMDAEAVKALGRSDITVKKYVMPHGWSAVVFLSSSFGFLWFSRQANFIPGSFLYENLLKYSPGFAGLCYRGQPWIIILMDLIHAGEATYMATSRLKKHSVPMFSTLWLMWVVSTFIEGTGAFVRFDRHVKEQQDKKAKAKH